MNKTAKKQLIDEIGGDLILYLKSGKLSINPYIKELNLNINNIIQLLKIHYLLSKDVERFIVNLPHSIRKFSVSIKGKSNLCNGYVKGAINWSETIQNRYERNYKDKMLFSCKENNKNYETKENLVIFELIKTLYNILNFEIGDKLVKYTWLSNYFLIKNIIDDIYIKNIYISRIKDSKYRVSDRQIEEVIKNRNPLYSNAAKLLKKYRRIINYNLNKEEVYKLFAETFIEVEETDTLFELFWVFKLIKDNAIDEKMYIMDGTNNALAMWESNNEIITIHHDSTGGDQLSFNVAIDEIMGIENQYIERKLKSIDYTNCISKQLFNNVGEKNRFIFSGRPDIIITFNNKENNKITRIVLGEVKHTCNKNYALKGLKELIEYTLFIKNKVSNKYEYINLDSEIQVQGYLFFDNIEYNDINSDLIKVFSINDKDEKIGL